MKDHGANIFPAHLLINGALMPVLAVPKASKSEIMGVVVDAEGKTWLKVRVAAPPEDGKANKALLRFLAKLWGFPTGRLTLISGETSRHKLIRID